MAAGFSVLTSLVVTFSILFGYAAVLVIPAAVLAGSAVTAIYFFVRSVFEELPETHTYG